MVWINFRGDHFLKVERATDWSSSGGFKKIVQRLGIDDVRIHDLRHTHASMLIEMNENPKIIQELLGHDDIRTTLNTYGHLMEGLGRETKDRFGSRFPITR